MNRTIGKDALALIAGGVLSLSLSPFDLWPFAVLSPALLFMVIKHCSIRRCMVRFYLYNLGLFGAGVSWIFVSVHEYGGASVLLATLLVAALVLSYSLLCLPLAFVFAKWLRANDRAFVLGFIALWLLQEWFRSWILTGFPWMYLGYGLLGTWLEHYAPLGGVFGVSLAALVAIIATIHAVQSRQYILCLIPIVILVTGVALSKLSFSTSKDTLTVSLVQGNVDQAVKWRPENRVPIMQRYANASNDEWGRDLIVWPEAAVTVFRRQAGTYLSHLDKLAEEHGTTLILGIPDRDETGGFLNTVVSLGEDEGQYIKRRLVPFGEYVPLEDWLRGIITLFDLPMSRNQPGPARQVPLTVAGHQISMSICYEVVYPNLVRTAVTSPAVLMTVSNDSWFGASIGPWQHLQMARMRSLENERDMVRATNNGVTAIIDHRGNVRAQLPQFETGVLRGEVSVRSGDTPYHRFGDYPVLLLCLALLAIAFWQRTSVRETSGA